MTGGREQEATRADAPHGAGSEPSAEARRLRALLEVVARPQASLEEVLAARRGIDEIFAAHQDAVYRVCLRFVGNPERAAELAQDTFATAYRRLGDLDPEGSFYAWLYGIARFGCLRANARRREILGEDGLFEPQDPARSVLAALRTHERDTLLREAAAAVLDPVEQEAVTMRYAMNMGVDQITEVLGITRASGARGVLQTARRKLRAELTRRLETLGHGRSLLFDSAGGG